MESLAGALVSSKVNKITKDLEDAVGLNEDEQGGNEVYIFSSMKIGGTRAYKYA